MVPVLNARTSIPRIDSDGIWDGEVLVVPTADIRSVAVVWSQGAYYLSVRGPSGKPTWFVVQEYLGRSIAKRFQDLTHAVHFRGVCGLDVPAEYVTRKSRRSVSLMVFASVVLAGVVVLLALLLVALRWPILSALLLATGMVALTRAAVAEEAARDRERQRFGPPRAIVGTDGLRFEIAPGTAFVTAGGGSEQPAHGFVPYTAITTVEPFGERDPIRIVLKDGRRIRISIPFYLDAERALIGDELFARLESNLARCAACSATPGTESRLERGGRTMPEWRAALSEFARTGGYRASTALDLWRVLESPVATPSARVGAAIALTASLDDAKRAKVRAIVEASAHEKLRVALAGVVAEWDGQLEAMTDVGLDDPGLMRSG